MTNDMMNLCELVKKTPEADLLCEMIGFAAERLMELEVGAATGAGYGEKALTAVIQEAYVQGISTRSVDDLVKAMGMTGISKSQFSRLCEEIDGKVKAFFNRPLEGDWPYLWIDATYLKVRRGGRIVSVAVTIAIRVYNDGRLEVLGLDICTSEAEPI
jgi:putative transposase